MHPDHNQVMKSDLSALHWGCALGSERLIINRISLHKNLLIVDIARFPY